VIDGSTHSTMTSRSDGGGHKVLGTERMGGDRRTACLSHIWGECLSLGYGLAAPGDGEDRPTYWQLFENLTQSERAIRADADRW
jgi:hypothetical protein